MHSSRMRAARFRGLSPVRMPPPVCMPLRSHTPWHSSPLPRMPPATHASENITLPKTSFAGGKNSGNQLNSITDLFICVSINVFSKASQHKSQHIVLSMGLPSYEGVVSISNRTMARLSVPSSTIIIQ